MNAKTATRWLRQHHLEDQNAMLKVPNLPISPSPSLQVYTQLPSFRDERGETEEI